MSDETSNHDDHVAGGEGGHKSPLSGLSTKQKAIGGGLIAVLGLGLWAASKRNAATAEPQAVIPKFELPDILYTSPNDQWGGSGSTIPPTNEEPVILPDDPAPIIAAPIVKAPAPVTSGTTGPAITVPSDGAIFGHGGIDYNASTTTAAQKAAIVANETKIKTDPAFVQDELARTATVIANRTAANMNTSEQVAYQTKLVNAAAAPAVPVSGAVVKVEKPIVVAAPAPVIVPTKPAAPSVVATPVVAPKPAAPVESNQHKYLMNLIATGTAGQKAWANAELAAGRY